MIEEKDLQKQLQDRLSQLSIKGMIGINKEKPTLEPLTALFHDGSKIYMERIIGTTKYLTHTKKVIYDLVFLKLYNFDKRIPEGCIAVNDWLLKIDDWAHIDSPARFLQVLKSPAAESVGTRFYLDDILYMDNVPFKLAEDIRNVLLLERNDGTVWFDVLKIVDPSGNETLFLPSKKAQRIHQEQYLIGKMAEILKKKKHVSTKKESRN